MKQRLSAWGLGAMALVLAGTLTVPVAAAQRRSSGGSSGGGSGGGQGQAVPRGGSQGSGRDSGGGQERAAPRGGGQERSTPRGGERADRQGDQNDSGSNEPGRRRGNQPRTGEAVVRTSPPRGGGHNGGGGGGVIIGSGYGGFYPWYGYGGYYGGYYGAYDPWFGWYPTYGAPGAFYDDDDEGALRLKVKPEDASVYVDGYYVGIVNDFDGVFQRLHLEPGAHRIEIRASEYQPLSFDVLIEPDHTTTYKGELVK